MSLSEELVELQRQRSAEVHTLHRTYLRTKREVHRMVSPARFVRKHIGISLAAATVLGIMLAPRGATRATVHHESKGEEKRVRGWFSLAWAKKILTHFFPEVAVFIPDEPEPAGPEKPNEESSPQKKEKSSLLMRLLELVGPILLSGIDWRALFNEFMHGAYQHMKEGASDEAETTQEARGAVAGAEAVTPDDFENSD